MPNTNQDSSTVDQIKSRSVFSASTLVAQSFYSAVLGFVAFFILTLKAGVYLLGIYNTVLAMMAFFNYFTNLGLAAAIVQKKDIKECDLSTAFFIQTTLSVIAVVAGFLATRLVFKFYQDLPPDAVYLYWVMLVSFFLLSLKTVPSVLLERKIEIYKVVLVQMVENTLFYLSIIVFVLLGFEIGSLIVAVFLRSVVGLVLIYILNPWLPKLLFSWTSAKRLLSFGIPFQGNSFLALVKDDLLTIYLGGTIGFTNLGFVTFGKKYAEFSLRMVMDNLNRVAFPLFSRFQKQAKMLKKSVEKVLFFESFLIFPIIIGALFIFDSLLRSVPGYFDKWQPALFSFYFFSFSAFFISLSTPFINLFNSIGKVKLSLYFMIFWTALTWITVPLFINLFGFNGISVAFFFMSLTSIIVFQTARRFVKFSVPDSYKVTFSATLAMTLYLSLVRILFQGYLQDPVLHLVFSVVGSAAVYFLTSFFLKGKEFYLELFESVKLNKKTGE